MALCVNNTQNEVNELLNTVAFRSQSGLFIAVICNVLWKMGKNVLIKEFLRLGVLCTRTCRKQINSMVKWDCSSNLREDENSSKVPQGRAESQSQSYITELTTKRVFITHRD